MHLDQLSAAYAALPLAWPFYALTIAGGLYTLKAAFTYIWEERMSAAAHEELPQDVEDWITNITPTETTFSRAMKDRSNNDYIN